jgi:hypothetical protein
LESTAPQDAPAQPIPEIAHAKPGLGFPAEITVPTNAFEAPSSTGSCGGVIDNETSLVT